MPAEHHPHPLICNVHPLGVSLVHVVGLSGEKKLKSMTKHNNRITSSDLNWLDFYCFTVFFILSHSRSLLGEYATRWTSGLRIPSHVLQLLFSYEFFLDVSRRWVSISDLIHITKILTGRIQADILLFCFFYFRALFVYASRGDLLRRQHAAKHLCWNRMGWEI